MNTQKKEKITTSYEQARERLARIIHDSWSIEPFNPRVHSEDYAAADAVLSAFPHIVYGEKYDREVEKGESQ
jgi:hypothetical protein